MKKYTAILLTIILIMVVFTGCGKGYDADNSTIFIGKGEKLVFTDVKEFDEAIYDKDQLEEYVKDAIEQYADEYGKKSVKFKELTVEDGIAKLTLEYASAEHYTRFQGFELFTGSIADALAKGYTFDAEFASVKDGEATLCDTSQFYENQEYKVVIVKANTNVQVKGTICYVSTENVTLVDESTVSIKPGNQLTFEQQESTETESATELMNDTESGSVGEDELVVGEESTTEIVFEFDETETESETSDFSSVYTYIIYK